LLARVGGRAGRGPSRGRWRIREAVLEGLCKGVEGTLLVGCRSAFGPSRLYGPGSARSAPEAPPWEAVGGGRPCLLWIAYFASRRAGACSRITIHYLYVYGAVEGVTACGRRFRIQYPQAVCRRSETRHADETAVQLRAYSIQETVADKMEKARSCTACRSSYRQCSGGHVLHI
jgi:hypothetical protein